MSLIHRDKSVELKKCRDWLIEVYIGRDEQGLKIRDYVLFQGSYKQAQLKDAELKIQATKRRQQKKAGGMTFTEYLQYWLKKITPAVNKSSLRTYTSHVKTLSSILGDMIISDEVKCCHLQDRLDESKKLQSLKPKSIACIKMTLKTAVHYAQNWDILSRDIASGLVTPKITKTRYDVLNRDELQSLLQALKQYKHGLMIRLIAVTGMRTEEAVALTWRDVVLKTSTIRITRAADVATRCLNDETKEPASIRTLQLDNETMAMLVEHMDIQLKGSVACLDGLVFPADDGRPLSYNSVRRTLQRALKTAGLRYVSPHKLRHGVASILDDEGCSSAQIAETLGHANPTVTNKIYAHALRHGKSILAD